MFYNNNEKHNLENILHSLKVPLNRKSEDNHAVNSNGNTLTRHEL